MRTTSQAMGEHAARDLAESRGETTIVDGRGAGAGRADMLSVGGHPPRITVYEAKGGNGGLGSGRAVNQEGSTAYLDDLMTRDPNVRDGLRRFIDEDPNSPTAAALRDGSIEIRHELVQARPGMSTAGQPIVRTRVTELVVQRDRIHLRLATEGNRMSTLTAVPVDQALDQLEFWLAAPWPMSEEEAGEMASALGWTIEGEWVYARCNDVPFQTVLGISKRDSEVTAFSFSLTGDVEQDDREAMDALKDAFSEYVAAGRSRWGKPAMKRGAVPTARWDFGERGGIRMHYTTAVVATYVTPNDLKALKVMNDW